MTRPRTLLLAAGSAAVIVGCGSSDTSTAVPQTGSNRPLTAATVDVRPTGDTDFVVDAQSVGFQVDNAGLLRMTAGVTSHATAASTVTMTATLLDSGGTTIGSATGGAVGVAPGSRVSIELTGTRPSGVIATVNLVIAGQPAPTPRS